MAAGASDPWDDAPSVAPAFCPRSALPVQRDATCSSERGRALLADALALPASPTPEGGKCSSAWSAELSVAARARAARTELQKRDRQLAKVEACAGLDAGLVRLTRAMLWVECADSLAVETPSAQLTVALRGYALAARLSRLVFEGPNQMPRTVSKGPEAPIAAAKAWTETKAALLRRANQAISSLPSGTHGRAAAELALGQAWNRLLHTRLDLSPLSASERGPARGLLQQALASYRAEAQPFEARAAHAGAVISEWSLLRAFERGQPDDTAEAARALVLPPLPPISTAAAETELRLAAGLPSYVASRLLPLEHVSGTMLRALLQQGFDPALRRALAERELSASDLVLESHGRTIVAARALAPEQAARAAELLRDLPGDDAAALASIASALAASLSKTPTSPSSEILPIRATSRHVALLTYNAWRLGFAGSASGDHLLETRARELAASVPALAACLPPGFIQEHGCVCPSVRTIY